MHTGVSSSWVIWHVYCERYTRVLMEASPECPIHFLKIYSRRNVPVNVDEMQKKLSQKAGKEPEHQFENLYGLLCNEVWLRVAHHAVNTNQGRETAGIDGETMSNFNGDLEGNLKRLQEQLKARTFEP